MPNGPFELASRRELAAAEPLVVGAFASQRRRFLETARGLRDEDWVHPTRCEAWDARELVLHVLGATDACRTTLTGERPVFGGSFDPNSSPNRFVASRVGEPVAATLEELDASISATNAVIEQQGRREAAPPVTAVWGEKVDWRLFVAHMFWDAWVHERDLLVPLGLTPEVDDAECRVAATYGLHTAAIVVGLYGVPLDAVLRLDGSGGGNYRVRVDGLDVAVTAAPAPPDDGRRNGDAVAVTDALAGRGPELATVLDATPEVLDALSGVREFLRGQTDAPPVPGR